MAHPKRDANRSEVEGPRAGNRGMQGQFVWAFLIILLKGYEHAAL